MISGEIIFSFLNEFLRYQLLYRLAWAHLYINSIQFPLSVYWHCMFAVIVN